MNNIFHLANEAETEQLGLLFGQLLQPGLIVFFQGELGAGKTCLIRAILRANDVIGAIKSPSYTLVESYETTKGTVYHFDFYRLASPDELEWLGIRDYFEKDSICLIEWPEQGAGFLPAADVICQLQYEDLGRQLVLHATSKQGEHLIEQLKRNQCAGSPVQY